MTMKFRTAAQTCAVAVIPIGDVMLCAANGM